VTLQVEATTMEPSQTPTCIYCTRPGPFTDEHILARAFAGPGEDWILTGLVCHRCNDKFSTYERAWTSLPGVAEARIHWGPAGRERKGVAYQVHPSENIFLIVNGDPVSYECEILRGTEARLRPQMVSAAKLFALASAPQDIPRFDAAAKAFWKVREITIQKRPKQGAFQFRVATLAVDETFRFERIELRPKPAAAWLDWFPKGMEIAADPRMSVDARGNLRFRVRKLRDVVALLNRALYEPCESRPGGTIQPSDMKIAIRSPYKVGQENRAVTKTVVNYAVEVFGREWVANAAFRPALDFCIERIDDPPEAPFVGHLEKTGIPAVDSCPPERHVLALCYNGSRIIGLVRLYGGSIYRVHLGEISGGIAPFNHFQWIDFNGPGRVPVGS